MINEISKTLEAHQQSTRIKKLIFCACKQYWENDIDILDTFPLEYLLEEIIEINSTLEECQESLSRVVKLLSRQDLYSSISKLIINYISKIYQQQDYPEEATVFSQPSLYGTENNEPENSGSIDEVVRRLSHHQNATRIKKIIVYIVQKKWINDPLILKSFNWQELIEVFYQNYHSLSKLEEHLFKVVNTLNRKDIYYWVAKTIAKEIGILYGQNPNLTRIIKSTTLLKNEQENPIGSDSGQQQGENNAQLSPNRTYIVEDLEAELAQNNLPNQLTIKYDIFAIRQDFLKYGNPLRAKILLFSLLYHSFDNSRTSKDWALLNTCSLNDLFIQALNKYENLLVLEKRILDIAEKMQEREEYLQAAGAINQSLKNCDWEGAI